MLNWLFYNSISSLICYIYLLWLFILFYTFCAYSVRFGENITIDPGYVDIFPASRIPKHIHHLLKPVHRFTSGSSSGSLGSWNNMKEKGLRITTDHRTLVSVMHWVSDEEVLSSCWLQIFGSLVFFLFGKLSLCDVSSCSWILLFVALIF